MFKIIKTQVARSPYILISTVLFNGKWAHGEFKTGDDVNFQWGPKNKTGGRSSGSAFVPALSKTFDPASVIYLPSSSIGVGVLALPYSCKKFRAVFFLPKRQGNPDFEVERVIRALARLDTKDYADSPLKQILYSGKWKGRGS
jgi:hypothetical protein